MTTFHLDLATHDLVVQNGAFIDTTDALHEIAQNVRIRLLRFRGEDPDDVNAGMPYLEEILAKGTDPARIQFLFRKEILDTPGVTSMIEGPELDYDPGARSLSISFRAETDEGDLIERGFKVIGRSAEQ